MKMIKEIYGLIYGSLPQSNAEDVQYRCKIENLLKPLMERPDWEQIWDIISETNAISQEYGFSNGFKQGVALMIECHTPPEDIL